jgi:3-dehydroquinate synthase
MQMKFAPPSRATRVRLLRPEALPGMVARAGAWAVVDAGVPGLSLDGARVLRVTGGEGAKRWAKLERILGWLAGNGAERSQALVAIGGGAVLDLAALAASLYRRGMPLFLAPTTLLGMVDATLGGKTAVDFESGGRLVKNFAGTFYPAREVWLAPGFLGTLPERERRSGAGEVYKTMWIRGRAWDEAALARFVRDGAVTPALARIVRDCLAVKARLVERDPLDEKRVRELLNFGHTVGHALESAAGGRLSHGECVLWGMAAESFLLGRAGLPMRAKAIAAARLLGLEPPPEFAALPEEEWVRLLGGDKKAKAGRIELSLLRAPGKPVKKRLSAREIAAAIRTGGAEDRAAPRS